MVFFFQGEKHNRIYCVAAVVSRFLRSVQINVQKKMRKGDKFGKKKVNSKRTIHSSKMLIWRLNTKFWTSQDISGPYIFFWLQYRHLQFSTRPVHRPTFCANECVTVEFCILIIPKYKKIPPQINVSAKWWARRVTKWSDQIKYHVEQSNFDYTFMVFRSFHTWSDRLVMVAVPMVFTNHRFFIRPFFACSNCNIAAYTHTQVMN